MLGAIAMAGEAVGLDLPVLGRDMAWHQPTHGIEERRQRLTICREATSSGSSDAPARIVGSTRNLPTMPLMTLRPLAMVTTQGSSAWKCTPACSSTNQEPSQPANWCHVSHPRGLPPVIWRRLRKEYSSEPAISSVQGAVGEQCRECERRAQPEQCQKPPGGRLLSCGCASLSDPTQPHAGSAPRGSRRSRRW